MPRSMTGFGASEGPLAGGRLAIELRSVNHRHFNPQFKLPSNLQAFEGDLRNRLRQRVERGHVTVTARWVEEPSAATAIKLNLERARAIVRALNQLKAALDLPGEADLGFVARQQDVLTVADAAEAPADVTELLSLVDGALDELTAMREREGEALSGELEGRLDGLENLAAAIEARAPLRLTAERERLRRSVAELMEGQPLDDGRLSQEIALLADKLDITEELVRLRTHLTACRAALGSGEPVGRRLAFLGQELLREINTIGSKANDADMTQVVVAMKGELEKVREQVENLE